MWEFLTGPIDRLRQYTEERATLVNFPIPEVWGSFRNSTSIVFDLMPPEPQWRKIFQGSLVRLLTPDQRLSILLGRISPRFTHGRFVWASVDATVEFLGGPLMGGAVSSSEPLPMLRYHTSGRRRAVIR